MRFEGAKQDDPRRAALRELLEGPGRMVFEAEIVSQRGGDLGVVRGADLGVVDVAVPGGLRLADGVQEGVAGQAGD